MSLPSLLETTEFVSALAGAFAGAGAAFAFQAVAEVIKDRSAKHGVIVRSQLVLGMQWQDLMDLKVHYLDQHREDPNRHRHIPGIGKIFTDLRLKLDELAFLASSPAVNVLNDVMIAQACFLTVQRIVDIRNDALDRLQAASQIVGADFETNRVKFELGPQNVAQMLNLKRQTDALFENTDHAIETIDLAIKALGKAGKECLIEKTFLKFGRPSDAQQPRIV